MNDDGRNHARWSRSRWWVTNMVAWIAGGLAAGVVVDGLSAITSMHLVSLLAFAGVSATLGWIFAVFIGHLRARDPWVGRFLARFTVSPWYVVAAGALIYAVGLTYFATGLGRAHRRIPSGNIVVVSGDSQIAPAGTLLPEPMTVRVLGRGRLPLPDVPVAFTAVDVYGVAEAVGPVSDTVVTDSAGIASTRWMLTTTGEGNPVRVSVLGVRMPSTRLWACGSFTGSSLAASVESVDSLPGTVIVRGGDWRRPLAPGFVFEWGDRAATRGFFPQRHVYRDPSQSHTIVVSAQYCDGGVDTIRLKSR